VIDDDCTSKWLPRARAERQEFLKSVHGMVGDAFEHMAQVEFRVESR
jgi:hypothetical protein